MNLAQPYRLSKIGMVVKNRLGLNKALLIQFERSVEKFRRNLVFI